MTLATVYGLLPSYSSSWQSYCIRNVRRQILA